MAKLVGDKKQKLFFQVVSVALLLCCSFLLSQPAKETNEGGNDTSGQLQEAMQDKVAAQKAETESDEDVVESMSTKVNNQKVKGIYVTGPVAGSQKKMDKLVNLVETTQLNAMVIDIKNDSGEITYKMSYDMAEEIGATKSYIKDINGLIKKLKEKNVYLIARIVTFKDPILAEKKPEYSIKNEDGTLFRDNQGLAWLNPYNRDVWKYVLNVAVRAANLGFDEVQFDYIRFPTASNMENVTYGKVAKMVNKSDQITQFTQCASKLLKDMGVKVSADVFGGVISSETDSENIGQNYVEMAKHLDTICPMIYPSQFANGCYGVDNPDSSPYDIVYRALKDSQSQLGKKEDVAVRPWLQDFTATWLKPHIKYDEEEVRMQIDAVYASGYDEWILWNAANNYTAGGIN